MGYCYDFESHHDSDPFYRSKVDINLKQETTNTPEGLRLLTFDNEKSSMCCLKNLLGHALEVLGMWKVLCDHQINIILQVNHVIYVVLVFISPVIFFSIGS